MNTQRGLSATCAAAFCSVASALSPVTTPAGAISVLAFQSIVRRARLAPERPHQPPLAGAMKPAIATKAGAIHHARVIMDIGPPCSFRLATHRRVPDGLTTQYYSPGAKFPR